MNEEMKDRELLEKELQAVSGGMSHEELTEVYERVYRNHIKKICPSCGKQVSDNCGLHAVLAHDIMEAKQNGKSLEGVLCSCY